WLAGQADQCCIRGEDQIHRAGHHPCVANVQAHKNCVGRSRGLRKGRRACALGSREFAAENDLLNGLRNVNVNDQGIKPNEAPAGTIDVQGNEYERRAASTYGSQMCRYASTKVSKRIVANNTK